MKKISKLVFVILFLTSIALTGKSQCRDFNEPACKDILTPYINYGNYISTVLADGEYAELNMTFYSKTEYRLAICGLEQVKNLEFRVFDSDHNLLFKNIDQNYTRTWDFKLDASQQLIIAIIVPEASSSVSGCVAVMHGLKTE